jgi:N-methylhydantoinase B
VIIPPVCLAAGGEIIPDTFNLILSQIRSKHETGGDFRAQLAANNTGIRRLQELVRQHSLSTVRETIDELVEYTERRTRSELNILPHGVFRATGQVDTDGYTDEPVKLAVRIVVNEEGVLFDFTGSDRQRRSPVNSTYAQTYSACAYILKALLDPDIPVNAGFYRFVRLNAPRGTVTNCTPPYPVVGGWETHMRLVEVALQALAPAMPDRVPAGTKGMICHSGFGGIDQDTGEYYCFLETLAGGYGARSRKDGPDAVQVHGQNTENAPVEETELNYPVRIVRYELIPDSEGAGKFRGGLGLRRDYMFPDRPTTFTVLADRDKQGPHGLLGGAPGNVAEYVLNPNSGGGKALPAKGTVELQPGDIVSFRTCGGGGYGNPYERDPAQVLRDVREGKVGLERARNVYGVVIDPREWVVDLESTERHRAGTGDE